MLAGTEAGIGHSDLLVPEFIPEITGGAAQIVVSDEAAHHARRKPLPPVEFRTSSVHAPVRVFIHPQPEGFNQAAKAAACATPSPPAAHHRG